VLHCQRGEEDVEANIMFEEKNFWVGKMKKIKSTDNEHISKNFFYFFLMQYNDYLIKIEIKFVHFYSCLYYFCFLPDLKMKVFIIFNLQCIYYIFHHLLFDRLKHLTKYFISPSHVSIFFQKIGISFFQKNVVYVNLFFQ
jgi:hypothetical protein